MDDVSKIQAVSEWPKPNTVKELQQFLSFANLYHWVIWNYSLIAAPLSCHGLMLHKKPVSPLSFTTAPILKHPDSNLSFVVEVDASDCGIWAVLSQCHDNPGKLYPHAFFSRKLNAAELNCNVGHKELLSMKAALEEWHHWHFK